MSSLDHSPLLTDFWQVYVSDIKLAVGANVVNRSYKHYNSLEGGEETDNENTK